MGPASGRLSICWRAKPVTDHHLPSNALSTRSPVSRARRVLLGAALLCAVGAGAAWQAAPQATTPAAPDEAWHAAAPGVEWRRYANPEWLDPAGPLQVAALRVDPAVARIESALAEGRTPALETIPSLAARLDVVAAVNAGFFGPNGRPAGVLKQGGHWIGLPGDRARGAVGFVDGPGGPRVLFAQLRVSLAIEAHPRGASSKAGRRTLSVDHLNPTGLPLGLALYTPPFVAVSLRPQAAAAKTSATASPQPAGAPSPAPGAPAPAAPAPAAPAPAARQTPFVALVCSETPCRVVNRLTRVPKEEAVPIPADGLVLVARGRPAVRQIASLARGAALEVVPVIDVERGDRDGWSEARDIVGGVGLLLHDGVRLTDWSVERFRAGFDTERHPRTLIGVDGGGHVWLVVVDGRRPEWSLGMRFDELQTLAERLGLRTVLNLDGGGSTTMVVSGDVVNRPTDLIGPRRVSDAIVVRPGLTRP